MSTVAPIQSNFNGGELSPTIEGRVDINKYTNGLQRMRGFIPLVQGPARRRSGTRFVAEVEDSTVRTWLFSFIFSDDAAFVLEFGDNVMRFYTNHARVTYPKPGNYSGVVQYRIGDAAFYTVDGNSYYCIKDTIGNLPTDPVYWYLLPTNPSVYEIPTPWSEADLTKSDGTFRLWLEQSADVIYITHPDIPTQKLIRLSNVSWTLTPVAFTNGPFIGVDPDETRTVYASAETGTGITLTASVAIFDASQIGSQMLLETKLSDVVPQWEPGKVVAAGVTRRSDGSYYLSATAGTTGGGKPVHLEGSRYDGDPGVQWTYLHSGYGVAQITAVGGGGTTATADVISRIPSQAVGVGNPTTRWSFAEFSEQLGYPSHAAFFRERLWLFRGTQAWASVASDFENFANRDGPDVTADMAISINFASDQINDIAWVAPANALLVGTVGNEFAISELSSSDPIGPANVQVNAQTSHGSRQVRPTRVNDSILFAQKSGRKLREIRFSFESNGYATTDLTVLAEHITYGQIIQMAYQQEPHSIAWSACNNGNLIGFTFNREQDVLGWHVHPIGGTAAEVESVAAIPSPDGARDELWLIVKRTISGATKRYVEYMDRDFISNEGMTLDDAFFVDSGLGYVGAPAVTFNGLDHLNGETVTGLSSGGVLMGTATVSAGSATFATPPAGAYSAPLVIGLPYDAKLTTMRIETGSDIGTAQGKIKRISDVRVRVLDTVGGVAGRDGGTLDAIRPDPDAPAGLYSDDSMRITWPAGYELAGRMTIQQPDPLPMTVVAIMPVVSTTG